MSGYPLLDAFLTMLYFFLFVLWFVILFRVIIDIFRSHELGGWGKAGWLIFVIILPFLGVFVYVIARGKNMAEHDQRDYQARQEAFNAQVKAVAVSTSSAEQLEKLADLHSRGVLTDAEYEAQKAKVLAS
jgi:flagellar biosynthesis/type III secretory pathway M-ring protein FliF/YscJ